MEQFIDIDHLDQEFAANVEYEEEITHVTVRLYYQLKERDLKPTNSARSLRN